MEAQKAAAAAAAAARQLDLLGYYHVLGFDIKSRPSSKISADDVKSAFRVLAKKMHPDTLAAAAAGGAPPDEAAVAAAAAAFQKLQKAYDVLKDPDMRKKYDRGEIKS